MEGKAEVCEPLFQCVRIHVRKTAVQILHISRELFRRDIVIHRESVQGADQFHDRNMMLRQRFGGERHPLHVLTDRLNDLFPRTHADLLKEL